MSLRDTRDPIPDLPTWSVMIANLGIAGLTYTGQVAAETRNDARRLIVEALAKLGLHVPYGAPIMVTESAGSGSGAVDRAVQRTRLRSV
jgi:hypothetical protein